MEYGISAVKTESYDLSVMKEAVRRHFEALEANALFAPGARVVLKPNLLMKRKPEEATTTNPVLVQAVAEHLREQLGITDIVIADSPGGPYSKLMLESIYAATGMSGAAARSGAVLNLETGYGSVETEEGFLCSSFNIIDPIRQADVVINLPKLKTHAMMTLSGAVKNLFGCIPGLQKPELHFRFPEQEPFGRMLVELAGTVRPALTIVDAVTAMEGDGPSSGTPKAVGWTFGARDVFALDEALCDVMGLDPSQVETVSYARQTGWSPDLSEIRYLLDGRPGDITPFVPPKSKSVDMSRLLPGPLQALGRRLASPRPVIHRRDCIGCGKCAESCPAKTIRLRKRKAEIDYSSCIKCYCCHEMCPVRAIHIRRLGLMRI